MIHGVPDVISLPEPVDDEDNDVYHGDTFDTIHFHNYGDKVTVPDTSTPSTKFQANRDPDDDLQVSSTFTFPCYLFFSELEFCRLN